MNNSIFKLYLLLALFTVPNALFAQKVNWQNMDLKADSVFGISTEKAYNELLKGKKSQTVIVAVIDAGVDTMHEDLKSVLWVNPKKKAFDNGTYGWSFIGSAKGNVRYDNLELTRQVRQQQSQFENKDSSDFHGKNLAAFKKYQVEKNELNLKRQQAVQMVQGMSNFGNILKVIMQKIGKDTPTLADFEAYYPIDEGEKQIKSLMMTVLRKRDDFESFKENEFNKAFKRYKEQAKYQLNINYDPRPIVGDQYFDSKQRNYGSPDVMGPDATHGTHVSGIIGALRNNEIGMNGVADNVQIMNIRTVPDGDERDKDVANAIRYATDHGAKVINMSFGKAYSQDKKIVDEAVKYAMRKDVLLVQAAGNENSNIDSIAHFPNRRYLNGKEANAYIVVGASGMRADSTIKASFSNYGKSSVDVFAPGVQIYSCIPGSKYAYFDGTSMASPVVAGLAALIREYYPKLSAAEVKKIIVQSVQTTPFLKSYCKTGGVVNAYLALKMAENFKNRNRP